MGFAKLERVALVVDDLEAVSADLKRVFDIDLSILEVWTTLMYGDRAVLVTHEQSTRRDYLAPATRPPSRACPVGRVSFVVTDRDAPAG